MGKYNSNKLTTKFVQDYMKNRLWEKNHSEYVPFLNVRSTPTKGKANRIKGWKTGREHHFLSKLEYAAFYHFEWCSDVVDIKEQYPLFPMEILQNIALEASIEYPNFAGSPTVMTTDFLISTKENDKITYYARTIKPSSELSNERVIEKFEIERRFFNSKGIDWGIITEKELPEIFTNNMNILHSNKLATNETHIEKQYLLTMYNQLAIAITNSSSKDLPIVYLLTQLSRDLNINFSNITEVFFKSVIDRILIFDIYNKPLDTNILTLNDIKLDTEMLFNKVNSL